MKVKCIATQLTDEQKRRSNVEKNVNTVWQLTIGNMYTVLGMAFMVHSQYYGSSVVLSICNDVSQYTSVPLCLFEIVDHRISKYWLGKKYGEFDLMLWPEEFYRDYFHDDLSEGDMVVKQMFKSVVERLNNEYL